MLLKSFKGVYTPVASSGLADLEKNNIFSIKFLSNILKRQ